MRKEEKKMGKKYILGLMVITGILFILVGTFYSSYALEEAIESISFTSQKLNYEEKEPGSIHITKHAKWVDKGKAKITFDLDTVLVSNDYNVDLILVLDTSSSMQGSRLDQMKKSVTNITNSILSNPKNHVALITYGKEAEIKTDFVNDTDIVSSQIELIQSYEESARSYYQGLLKVDDILKNYEKKEDTECVILFLANGSPSKDSPNQVGEYNYLKSRYPYIEIRGFQYEVFDNKGKQIPDVLESIQEISEVQYIVNQDTLEETLIETTVFSIPYDILEIEDTVNAEYFQLDSISNLEASYGKVEIGKDKASTIHWDLEGLESGKNESFSFEVDLKDEYINQESFFSTNEEESVNYQIEGINEKVIRTETPVLSNYYTVEYDSNLPGECSVSEIPEARRRIVYDVVEISEIEPSCEGYQFEGWKVVTEGA